jgi:anthranilate phosphoribosyltransferase
MGRGPKACRDLTREKARGALGQILDQEVPRARMGCFLLIERFKRESAEELLGIADAMRARARTIHHQAAGLLDIGSSRDGRWPSLVVSPAAARVAVAIGLPTVMHSEKDMPPKHGVRVIDVLEALGIHVDAEPEAAEASLQETGFGFIR